MPELPEVETVRRGLEPRIKGRQIETVTVYRRDLRIPVPEDFESRVAGRRIVEVGRRGKYLLISLQNEENGEVPVIVIHLGMSGRILLGRDVAEESHVHASFELEGGDGFFFADPRRFGLMTLIDEAELGNHKLFRGMGPEPLGNQFSESWLRERAEGRKTSVKMFLLDQRTVAGLGNIYVCEALHLAGISPKRKARSLGKRRIERLYPQIRAVLNSAIAAGGSTLRDYVQSSGESGYFQHGFKVYGREGEPCIRPDCGGKIRRIVQSGRSSFYCPSCQR